MQLKGLTNLHPNPCDSKYWHIFGRAGHGNKFNKQSRAITVGWRKQRHEDHVSDSLTVVSTIGKVVTQHLQQLQLLDTVQPLKNKVIK